MEFIKNTLPSHSIIIQNKISNAVSDLLSTRLVDTLDSPGFAVSDGLSPHMHHNAIYEHQKNIHEQYLGLAKCIVNFALSWGWSSPLVLELGSGGGSLFEHLFNLGISQYLAVDGNPFILDVCEFAKQHSNNFRILNLEYEVDFAAKFNIVLSFDLLEHISNTTAIVKTITNHMDGQSFFIGTVSEELSDCHVVKQNREWWISELQRSGLREVANSNEFYAELRLDPPRNWGGGTHLFVMQLKE